MCAVPGHEIAANYGRQLRRTGTPAETAQLIIDS